MVQALPDDPIYPLMTELYGLLTREDITEGTNLLIGRQDNWVLMQIMAASTAKLGLLLASLSDPEELENRTSLTRRLTPGESQREPDDWRYELVVTRYPTDRAIVFSAKIQLPVRDLPEVVARLSRAG
jgi:hypothetical protein